MRRNAGAPLGFGNILFCYYNATVCYIWKAKIFTIVCCWYEPSLIHIQIKLQYYLNRPCEYRTTKGTLFIHLFYHGDILIRVLKAMKPCRRVFYWHYQRLLKNPQFYEELFFYTKVQQEQPLFLWEHNKTDSKHCLDSLMIVYLQVIIICLSSHFLCLKFMNIIATRGYSYH